MMTSLKIKNQLIQLQEKGESLDFSEIPALEADEEVKEEER